MLKAAIFFASIVSISTHSGAASPVVDDVVASSAQCLQLADKKGVSLLALTGAGWQREVDGSYGHPQRASHIKLPADDDGVNRICVVLAAPLSKADQKDLSKALSRLLKSGAMKQSDSEIWMIKLRGTRGLQLYHSNSDGSPVTRVIAAQF